MIVGTGVNSVKRYLEIFLTFAKIGVMTFGGGMTMLPILQREIIDNKGWADEAELMDYYALSQCSFRKFSTNSFPNSL